MGIQILESLSIYERLFVDDMGIMILAQPNFFKQVEDCIILYEQALGAKINIRKSSLIPLGLQVIP